MSHAHNHFFLTNPVDYLSKVVVLTISSNYGRLDPNNPYGSIYLDLVNVDSGIKSGHKIVCANFDLAPKAGDTQIKAGYVPYASEGDVKNKRFLLPALELPQTLTTKFIFTGAMNGCSLILASNRLGRKYAIHYPNSNGARNGYPLMARAGYTYEKTIDYYRIGNKPYYGTEIGGDREAPGKKGSWYNMFAFFYYNNGHWNIISQPQIVTMNMDGTFTGKINGNVIIV